MSRFPLLLALLCTPMMARAQAPTQPQRPSRPVATIVVRGHEVRAPDSKAAQHITPTATDWQFRVDSISNGAIFGYSVPDHRSWPEAWPTAVLPLTGGRMGTPVVVVERRPRTGISQFNAFGTPLPAADAEIAARHRTMRRLLENAHVFEGVLITGSSPSTLRFSDSVGDAYIRMTTTRSSRVVGDTVIGSRAVTVVRDSTTVTLDHAYALVARFIKDARGHARESVSGTIVGVRYVDTTTSSVVLARDIVNLQGTLVLDDPIGGTVRSPLVILESRESSFRDATWQDPAPSVRFDIVVSERRNQKPATPSYRDSLLAVINSSSSIASRDSARRMFTALDMRPWLQMAFDRSLAIGDTGATIAMIDENPYGSPPLTIAGYRLLRLALRDPSFAFRHGIDRELVAVNLVDGLSYRPPALPDSRTPFCEPDACRAMSADVRERTIQPLFAVGLVARMVTEPRIWTDSVARYSGTNGFLGIGHVRSLAFGAASSALAHAKAPIPEPDASYDAWVHWYTATDSLYARLLNESPIRANMSRPRLMFAPSEQAGLAIRFTEIRTGKPYAISIRQRRMAATTDSARALFTALSMSIGETVYDDAELVKILLDPASAERQMAIAELGRRRNWERAPDSIQVAVGRFVVARTFADDTLGIANRPLLSTRWMKISATDSLPWYVTMDSLPDAVRAYAAQIGFAPQPPGWQLEPGDSGVQTSFSLAESSGPFVRMNVSRSTLQRRTATRSGGYASGSTLILVRTPGGWVVVHASTWVT